MATYDFSLLKHENGVFTREIIKKIGLDEGGIVQQKLDAEFLKNVEPYVPLDEHGLYENPGQLINSVVMSTVIGSGHIEWNTPYARRLYTHPEYNFQGGENDPARTDGDAVRGAYWPERYLQNGGLEQLQKVAAKSIGENIRINGARFHIK